jgi:acetolactate synthase I/II/III large subunit
MTSIDTSDQHMTGGKIVRRALRDNGVKHIFGDPCAAVLPIYDELLQQDEIMHILPKLRGVRGRGRNN